MWAHPQAKHQALEGQGKCQPFIHLQVQQPAPSAAGYLCPKDMAESTVLLSRERSARKMRRWAKAQLKLPRALQRGRGDQV